MSIGHLLLYAALVVVAVWLVAELLLQHRAPVHWRALALAGFLCVVAGMALGSVPVIGAGAAAFAVGQVFVTLAVKQGRPVGWSLRRPDGSLPGPLARVPLLAAATGGAAVAAAAVVVEPVGEVGPVEVEQPAEPFAQMQELTPDDGIYSEAPAPGGYDYSQQYYQPDYGQQQQQQQWQEQPVGYGYEQQQYQYEGQYQDPYAQQQPQQQVQPQYEYQPQQPQQQQQQQWDYQPQWDQQQHG
ncbi:hypothetical protein [Kitasatospora sp. McL0602]|uniref:hypothetical protein n=1 Tax=Kitasatospora sp. McL0602 TaxID=3439530 RepID=UPI003F8C0EEB